MPKFTKMYIDKLPFTTKKNQQKIYWDSSEPGFGIVVGNQSKTFIVQRDVHGKARRKKVGRYSQAYPLAKAKARAEYWLGEMTEGRLPWKIEEAKAIKNAAEEATEEAKAITLEQAFKDFIEEKEKALSPKSIEVYRQSITYLDKWYQTALKDIDRKMVSRRHAEIGTKHGKYQSNQVFRTFRAVYNFANDDKSKLPNNPTDKMTWFKKTSKANKRNKPIPNEYLPVFWRLLDTHIENPMRRDYLRLVLFTGLRRRSACAIKVSDIDLENKTLHIPNPKGGEERAYTMPLSDYLCTLIKGLMEDNDSKWLFPSKKSATGHISDPAERPFVKALEVETGYHLTVHGLRHTFITTAGNMKISYVAVKMLVNHALPKNDITSEYNDPDTELLREPMQQITTRLLSLVEPSEGRLSDKAVEIRR